MAVAMASINVKEKPKKRTPKHIPLNTEEYLVRDSDSLASIALRFNTTPAELSRLNRLPSRMLYPGQTLFVPGHFEAINQEKETRKDSIELVTQEPKGVVTKERPLSPDHQIEELLQRDSLHSHADEISEKYLKIKAKFITDGQGVVSGIVLITPQTFMFNPCVSDHLVIERGRDAYALRVPLKSIAQIAFFSDIAAMVTGDRSGQICPSPSKRLETVNSKNKFSSSLNDMSQTMDSAICQETGERISCDGDTSDNITTEDSAKINSVCTENSLDMMNNEQTNNDRKNSPVAQNTTASSSNKDVNFSEHCTSSEEDNADSPRDACRFKSDTRLSAGDFSLTDMEVDGDITHSCPDLSKKDDSSCLQIMRDSQSTSTPKKLPDIVRQKNPYPLSPKASDSPTHSALAHSLIDSPLRVRKLTKNRDNLTHLALEEGSDNTSKENGRLPSVDGREQKSCSSTGSNFYKLASNDSDSEDERSQFPDMSRDSGISEGVSVQSSASHRRYNGDSRNQTAPKSKAKRVLSPRSSLSDEARLWLGSRGIRFGSESESSDVSLTETTETFAEELLPRPAARYEDPPVYLCLRIHRSFWCPSRERSSSIMGVPPNRDQSRREHWFALPKERTFFDVDSGYVIVQNGKTPDKIQVVDKNGVDQIYAFFLSWSPNLDTRSEASDDRSRQDDFFTGSREEGLHIVDDTFSCSPATQLGFEKLCHEDVQDRLSISSARTLRRYLKEGVVFMVRLIRKRYSEMYGSADMKMLPYELQLFGILPESFVNKNVEHKFTSKFCQCCIERDKGCMQKKRSVTDEDLPDMLDSSDLFTNRHISLLSRELPSRTVGHSWTLVYSTAVHGISLRTLYRNMLDVDSPVLLAVVDENSKMFGTFMSDAPRISDGFYGTGESMLFTFVDENHLKIYHWSGENNFFIKGDAKSLCIGGGDGLFGLWLDEDLYHGRSHSCKTFNNETLSFKEDFICSSLEAWTFV